MRIYFTLLIILAITACTQLDDPLRSIEAEEVIELSLVDTDDFQLSADCVSTATIKAVLGNESDAGQAITFSSTEGLLTKVGEEITSTSTSQLTVTPGHREFLIQIHALDHISQNVIVSATVNGVVNTLEMEFTPAYPDDFHISPSIASVDSSDTVSVQVQAFKQYGVVSEKVLGKVSIVSGDSIKLEFPEIIELRNQKATFEVMNVTQKKGTCEVGLTIPVAEGDSITRKLILEYN